MLKRLFRSRDVQYFTLVERLHRKCERTTTARIPKLGKKGPLCFEKLLELLPLLDILACCGWGCPGDDDPHIIQRITGRAVSHTNAGIRLLKFGHYDEALVLARGVAEAGNLLFLFVQSPEAFKEWTALDDKGRWNRFRPSEVRKRLSTLSAPIPIGQADYEVLSSTVSHIGPATRPQTYNPAKLPTLGGYYQEVGFLVGLNEVGHAVAILGVGAGRLAPIPKDAKIKIRRSAAALVKAVGAIRLKDVPELFEKMSGLTAR